jgi:hypothetical protein
MIARSPHHIAALKGKPSTPFGTWCQDHCIDLYTAARWLGLGSYHTAYQYATGLRRLPGSVRKLMQYIDKYGVIKEKAI